MACFKWKADASPSTGSGAELPRQEQKEAPELVEGADQDQRHYQAVLIPKVRWEFLICLFLVVATFVPYWQMGTHDFIVFDDNLYVSENPHVKAGLTLKSITWAFTAGHAANWHPLTWLSHMLDSQIYGINPGNHHLSNLLFHMANTLLWFLILKQMTGALWKSAFVAALFALHPLHVESVAWLSERKDVLSTFFWILTLWAYVRYVRSPKMSRYFLVCLFLSLGLMSKPMLVTLPCVLILLDYWPLGNLKLEKGFSSVKKQTAKIPFFGLAIVSACITFFVQQSAGAMHTGE
ncbi:MAG: hypothetical protein DRI57_24435, partial [Deltaproteobacteria bacterium]